MLFRTRRPTRLSDTLLPTAKDFGVIDYDFGTDAMMVLLI